MAEERDSLRPRRENRMADVEANGVTSSPSSTTTKQPPAPHGSPFLPTPLETLILAVYPAILLFGTVFSVLSPETRGAPYDPERQSHVQALAPSYFARKDNVFNIVFVKRGWLWITGAFVAFLATHPALRQPNNIARAAGRWALVTGWWILVTQWCFGPALIDRGFRFTGGKCEVAYTIVSAGVADHKEFFTAAACRAAGGSWSGGHDISGHVFLLVLGSCFLLQEVTWVLLRGGLQIGGSGDDRAVIMHDGAVKSVRVEARRDAAAHEKHPSVGGKFALGVVGLSFWMLLMTAAYFHTWFEKLTGLLVASMAVYAIYILPRAVPALRSIIGLPGV